MQEDKYNPGTPVSEWDRDDVCAFICSKQSSSTWWKKKLMWINHQEQKTAKQKKNKEMGT